MWSVEDKGLILYCFQASCFQFSVMQMYSKELSSNFKAAQTMIMKNDKNDLKIWKG